jgi:hypothetical protein
MYRSFLDVIVVVVCSIDLAFSDSVDDDNVFWFIDFSTFKSGVPVIF